MKNAYKFMSCPREANFSFEAFEVSKDESYANFRLKD